MPPGVVNGAVPATAVGSGLAHSATAASPAVVPSSRESFQTSTVCVTERDPVQCGQVAVLTRHRDLTGQALGIEGGDDAAGHAVVLGEHGVDLVVLGREDLLHRGLGDRRVPVVGVGLADDLDGARRDGLTDDRLVAVAQEVGVGVGGVALDDHVPALWHDVEDRLGLELADLDVVERDVEGARVLDQAVVGDDRHTLPDRARHRGLDGRAVLGEDDEHVGAL